MSDSEQSPLLNQPIKTADIIAYLKDRYSDKREWAYFPELRAGTGYAEDSQRYIDFWVINCFGNKSWMRRSYEVKISRSDWLAELKKPLKKRMGLLLSNEFYFIAPKGIIKQSELPIETGLIELDWIDNRKAIDSFVPGKWPHYSDKPPIYQTTLRASTTVNAPWRDVPPPSWKFVASLVRRINFENDNEIRHEEPAKAIYEDCQESLIVKTFKEALPPALAYSRMVQDNENNRQS
jgi:hypothetical protein